MRLYEKMVRRLYQVNLFHPAKMGLANINRLHRALGSPIDNVPAVHIAGTNGKGSVALKMARSLQLGGVRTGLFVSPHVSSFRERMQVDGEFISEESVEILLSQIFDLCETEGIQATFFEIVTALAFQHFRRSKVDAVVVETGLGGRLDATNIITPVLSIITSVGLEHTRVLGDTADEIAQEKAGIIKPGVPVLVGDRTPVELLREIARSRGAPFYRWADVLPGGTAPPAADFDEENTRQAEAGLVLLSRVNPGLRVHEDALKKGISQRPPCRFEVLSVTVSGRAQSEKEDANENFVVRRRAQAALRDIDPDMEGVVDVTVVLDVAHNPPAIDRLLEKAEREFPGRRIRVVVALSGDKDAKACLEKLLRLVDPSRIHVSEAATRRATPASTLAEILSDLRGEAFTASRRSRSDDQSVRQALRDALVAAARSETDDKGEREIVIVCGSIYMMVDARQELGLDEPQDSPLVAEVAGSRMRASQEDFPRSGTHG